MKRKSTTQRPAYWRMGHEQDLLDVERSPPWTQSINLLFVCTNGPASDAENNRHLIELQKRKEKEKLEEQAGEISMLRVTLQQSKDELSTKCAQELRAIQERSHAHSLREEEHARQVSKLKSQLEFQNAELLLLRSGLHSVSAREAHLKRREHLGNGSASKNNRLCDRVTDEPTVKQNSKRPQEQVGDSKEKKKSTSILQLYRRQSLPCPKMKGTLLKSLLRDPHHHLYPNSHHHGGPAPPRGLLTLLTPAGSYGANCPQSDTDLDSRTVLVSESANCSRVMPPPSARAGLLSARVISNLAPNELKNLDRALDRAALGIARLPPACSLPGDPDDAIGCGDFLPIVALKLGEYLHMLQQLSKPAEGRAKVSKFSLEQSGQLASIEGQALAGLHTLGVLLTHASKSIAEKMLNPVGIDFGPEFQISNPQSMFQELVSMLILLLSMGDTSALTERMEGNRGRIVRRALGILAQLADAVANSHQSLEFLLQSSLFSRCLDPHSHPNVVAAATHLLTELASRCLTTSHLCSHSDLCLLWQLYRHSQTVQLIPSSCTKQIRTWLHLQTQVIALVHALSIDPHCTDTASSLIGHTCRCAHELVKTLIFILHCCSTWLLNTTPALFLEPVKSVQVESEQMRNAAMVVLRNALQTLHCFAQRDPQLAEHLAEAQHELCQGLRDTRQVLTSQPGRAALSHSEEIMCEFFTFWMKGGEEDEECDRDQEAQTEMDIG
uniref:ATR-interacting protein isoform X2 n=1 Tax=Myxine glutinosa TaxID=7769 RepID=UPI00358F77DD